MFKKILITLFGVILASTCFAMDEAGNSDATTSIFSADQVLSSPSPMGSYIDTAYYFPKTKNEFYAGIGGIYTNAPVKRSLSYSICQIPFTETENYKLKDPGIRGALGYGIYYKLFYIGGEAFGSWDNLSQSISDNNSKVTVTMNYSFGGSLIAGIQIFKPTLIFFRLGVTASQINLKATNEILSSLKTQNKTPWGVNFGFGVRQHFTDNFGMSFEYIYTNYQDIKTDYDNSGADTTYQNKFKLHSNQLTLNLELYL